MHEAYEIFLDDIDEPTPIPATSCPGDDEVVVHVRLLNHDGDRRWHRRLPDLSETSCELEIHSEFSLLRRETLDGDLCSTCFTPRELAIAEARRVAEDAAAEQLVRIEWIAPPHGAVKKPKESK